MMYLHCKMIDLKDLNIVYKCQNQHCSSYSSCLLVKFINWRCVLLTERKSVRPFFFSFQRNRQAPSMAQSVKQPLSCQVYQPRRISFSLFFVIHFSQRVSNWSLVPRVTLSRCRFMLNYSSFKRAMNSCINCQFVGYGRGWIRKWMLECLNANFCWVQRVFPYKRFEEIGFYNIQRKTSYCDDSELLFILRTSFSVFIF